MNGLKEALNKIFSKTSRFCCFTSPYEADQQMAYMYYHRRVDVVLSADSDMLFYNVPFVRDWDPARRCGSYYPQDYLKKYLAGLPHPLPVEDYLILKIIKNGCDFFPYGAGARYRGGKFSFVFSDCRRYVTKDRFVQTLVHALYQFFYQSVFDISAQHIVSLFPMPALEARVAAEVLDTYSLGPQNPRYCPVARSYAQWFY